MSTPRQTASPRELLVPYIAWLRDRCLGMDTAQTNAGETKISFGRRALALDPWAIERLKETLSAGATPAEHGNLLAEVVALLLKCMADSERFAAATTGKVEQYYRLQAELMLDSNLGVSLVARTRREVDSLIQRGMTEEARQLSGVMHKLRSSLVEVNRNAGTKVEAPSTEDAGPAIATPDRPTESTVDLIQDDDAETADRGEPTIPDDEALSYPEPPVAGPGRTRFLAGVLALALGIWFVAIELPKLFGSHPRPFRISELQAPPLELSIHSRWPGLYVEVRGEAWNALGPEERERLVVDLVERASQREFTSILVRTVDGRSLAQWWNGRDVRWIDAADVKRSVASGTETPDAIETGLPAS